MAPSALIDIWTGDLFPNHASYIEIFRCPSNILQIKTPQLVQNDIIRWLITAKEIV